MGLLFLVDLFRSMFYFINFLVYLKNIELKIKVVFCLGDISTDII